MTGIRRRSYHNPLMSSASEPDLNIPLLISLYQQTQASSYAYLAALTVIAHDTLLLFEEERQHIYKTTKLFSNTVEMALVLAKLYKALGDIDDNPLAGLERMRKWRPVVYVFYRDGTLFFVPLFLISFFAFLNNQGVLVSPVSWTMWLSLIYCTCGTRLILNLRVVNCKLLESSIPGQLSTIQFDHDTTQNHSSEGRSGNTFIE
ncbi:hypothetical protein D9756_009351 [Leucocoprinus leucothites]|uniref:Uncharacterized protein n=1 Tax=Leucocoprinus leucothites TaxID=201217 RepID=A0A8H5CWD9_9AGAR|nr:hypothetical protein D9756_009351 [Leucoagaricus leucothites]